MTVIKFLLCFLLRETLRIFFYFAAGSPTLRINPRLRMWTPRLLYRPETFLFRFQWFLIYWTLVQKRILLDWHLQISILLVNFLYIVTIIFVRWPDFSISVFFWQSLIWAARFWAHIFKLVLRSRITAMHVFSLSSWLLVAHTVPDGYRSFRLEWFKFDDF